MTDATNASQWANPYIGQDDFKPDGIPEVYCIDTSPGGSRWAYRDGAWQRIKPPRIRVKAWTKPNEDGSERTAK